MKGRELGKKIGGLIYAMHSCILERYLGTLSHVLKWCKFSSVQSLSRDQLFTTPWTAAYQASLPSPTPRAGSNSCPLSQWCHPTISSSLISFSWLQSFPASGSFQMSQFFARGGQSIGTSASASVLPMTIQDWFPLGWTGWISLQSKGLKSLLQHHSSKASIFQCSVLFIVQLSHPYMTTGETTALTRWTHLEPGPRGLNWHFSPREP